MINKCKLYLIDKEIHYKGSELVKIIWKTVVLVILTSFLFYMWSGNFAPLQQQVKAEGEVSGSTIGGQEVESLEKDEIISVLNAKITEWKQNPILLTGNNTDISLNPEWFTFDVEATVEQYENQMGTPWYAFWKSAPTVHIPLQFTTNPELITLIEDTAQLDTEETIANINNQVGILSMEPIETIALDLSMFQTERIAFSLENIAVNSNGLTNIVSALNEQVIGSGEVFSLLDGLKEINVDANRESVDFVASVLYSVLLQTNVEIVERHSQGIMPNYLEPGIEAKIRKNTNKDLKFIHTNSAPIVLKVQLKGTDLLVEIYSVPLDTEATYRVADKVEIKPKTIYRYSAKLKAGQEKLVEEGKAGLRVSVYRTISEKKGSFEKEELISADYYPPINRVIMKSSLVPETPTVADPDLEMDLNGDGFPDVETKPSTETDPKANADGTNKDKSTETEIDEETGLPIGTEYDKGGKVIDSITKE
ncbi:surface rod structure-forming protein G [Psychrobacillus insolitus]|uniref:Surface rod structure-forming protein G n=1 Tax=Psychrobacillus insolitus TaxID=1461 RepID=A0A2W7MPK0_9BACI|nr:surface rod structure-forming protein G [Psychrobacillus insolitus]